MKSLRHHRFIVNVFLVMLTGFWQITMPLHAATINWTAGSAIDLSWATAANWNLGVPSLADDVVFGTPVLNPGSLANPRQILLGAGSLAGSLNFADHYSLTGGNLTLGSAHAISVSAGKSVLLQSQVLGTQGLIKAGAGLLSLNGMNGYTGGTDLNGGALRIWNDGNLGAADQLLRLGGGTLQVGAISLVRGVEVASNSTLDVGRNFTASINGVLSGVGTLTKTGNGELRLNSNNPGFTGILNVDRGIVRMRTSVNDGLNNFNPGLSGASGYVFGNGSQLILDNSVATSTNPVVNMISDTAPLTFNGGRLSFVSNNAAGNTVFTETAGNVILAERYSSIAVTRTNATSAAVLDLGSLTQQAGATVNFVATSLGATGNNPRITFRTAPTLNDEMIGGWALVNGSDFAGYNAAQGVGALGTTGFGAYTVRTGADIGTATAVENVSITAGNGTIATLGNLTINSLRLTASASTPALLQTAGTTLTIDSGGIIALGNFTKTLGTSTGFIKANGGGLYIHNNESTLTLNSQIQDGDVSTALVKDQAGALTLGAGGNSTYTGGTYVNGGTLTTGSTAGRTYLGTGPVFVDSASLVLQRNGATSSTEGYRVKNGGNITLTNNIAYTSTGDRFNIAAGSTLTGTSAAANQGFNSLTRVSAFSGGGQVILAPDSILAYAGTFVGEFDLANLAVKDLGSLSDIYFGLGTAGTTGSVTVGVGTPFKGLSTDRTSRAWTLGTLNVAFDTTDIYLQGLMYPDSVGNAVTAATLTLGDAAATGGGFTINPYNTNAFNARITSGVVALNDENSVFGNSVSAPMTFVVEPGAILQGSTANSLGSGSGIANVRVTAGGTLQQIATAGISADLAFNGSVTVEGGGRFLAQNPDGLDGTGVLTFDPGSILQVATATGWSGVQADATLLPDSVIVRLGVVGFGSATQPLLTQPSFSGAGIYQIFGANSAATNPTAPGTVILNLNNGGIITNDNADRNWAAAANGIISVGVGGGIIAASTGTFLSMQNVMSLGANTLTVGSTRTIDGNLKTGEVRFAATVNADPGALIDVSPGVALRLNAANVLSDNLTIQLGSGSLLNVDNAESIFQLTGAGTLVGDSVLTLLDHADSTFNSTLNGTTTGFGLAKQGYGVLTLANALSTGSGSVTVRDGTLRLNSGSSHAGYSLVSNALFSRATAILDLNGTSQGAASLTLQGGTATSTPIITGVGSTINLAGPVTYTSTNNPLGGVISVSSLSLGNTSRLFNIGNSTSAVDDLTVSSNLTGDAGIGIIKQGAGTLRLSGVNALTGPLEVQAGSVFGSLGMGNLLLSGGTIETSGSFTRALGTADGEVRWGTGTNGGFAARGGPLTVALAGAPSPLVWDSTPNFVNGAGQLLFGSVSADDVITFTHPVDLNGAVRVIQVLDNAATANDKAILSGVLSGVNGGINKIGAGVLELSQANTYTGATTLTLGTLQLNNASNGGLGSGSLNLVAGTLQALQSGISIANDVLLTAVTIAGTESLTFNAPVIGATGGSRTLTNNLTTGTLTLGNVGINNDITVARTMALAGTGATVVNGVISNGNGDAFANSLNLTGTGLITLNGLNTYTGTTTVNTGVGTVTINNNQAFGLGTALTLTSGTLQGDGSGAKTLSQNVTHNTGTVTLGGVDKFIFNGTWLTSGGTRTLTVNTLAGVELNGLMTLGETTNNRAQAFAGPGDILITGVIQNNPGATAPAASTVLLQYTGNGTLTLTGANTYTGATTINNTNGTLSLNGAGKLSVGNLNLNAGTLNVLASGVDQTVAAITTGGAVAGSQAWLNIGAGRTLNAGAVTYSSTNNNLTSMIQGLGTLNLGAADVTVTVGNSTAVDVDMAWTVGTLLGSGTFIKAGPGTLDISGIGINNFTGPYQVNAGTILGLGSLTNNLILNGGVYEGAGSFTRALGTLANQVQWAVGTAGGGFSARGGNLSVALGSATDPLIWASTPQFVSDGAPLIFGSVTADAVVDFTNNVNLNGALRTVQVVDNTLLTTDWAKLSGVLSNGSLTKTGNGILELSGANTFTGDITVTQGVLQFSTVSDNAGGPSNLGQGSNGLFITAGTLSFVGPVSQVTNRGITLNGASITTVGALALGASGTGGATITYTGAINTAGNLLTLTGTGEGFITGGIIQTGTAADVYVNSGTWTINGAPGSSILADDLVSQNAGSVLNLGGTGSISHTTGTSNGLYSRAGGVVNLLADNVFVEPNGLDFILLSDSGVALPGTLNMNTFNLTTPRLDLGQVGAGLEGIITGSGTLTVTAAINLFRGNVAANLSGAGATLKLGQGEVIYSGNNSGLTGATTLTNGTLKLDYTTNNLRKISSGLLTMNGASLILDGNSGANTVDTVNGLTLGGTTSAGRAVLDLRPGAGRTLTLNLGAITRTAVGGVLNVILPSSNSIVTTTTTNPSGQSILGGWATVNNSNFATVSGGNIVANTAIVVKDNITTWTAADNVIDGAGYNGTLTAGGSVNSLTYEAAGASTVTVADNTRLTIGSGGILVKSGAGSGGVVGGLLGSGFVNGSSTELFVHQHSSNDFTLGSTLNGTLALSKTGVGTLVLNGSSLQSGQTSILEGTLRVQGGNAIGDRSIVYLKNLPGVVFDLNNGTESIGGLAGGGVDGGTVNLGTGTLNLNVFATGTYSGFVSGAGNLIKNGTSTLTVNTVSNADFTGNLIINQGAVTLGNRTVANFPNLGSLTLNSGSLTLDFAGGTEGSPNKLNSSAPVTLINTGGIDGLRANNDRNDASKAETIGATTLLGGANTITASASSTSGTTQRAMTITAATLARSNQSTLLVRGQNLGTQLTAAPLDPLHTGRIVVSTAPTLTGGAGAAGTLTTSILPWAIGAESITSTGTSFVTYAASTGFRPLNLTTEYEQLISTGGITATNNVRFSSAASLTLDGVAKTMNSLLVENTGSGSMTLAGANAALNITSGALLFTGSQPLVLSGFSSITTGALNEYVLHVPNTATAGVTIASPFTTTAAALTKSGTGTLILTGSGSTYTGQTAINQGVLQIDSLARLGNNGRGGILLNAGTLRFGAAFDLSQSPVILGVPTTGTVATSLGGTLDTNGFDITFANSIGGGGNGGLNKIGLGTLTLNAPVTYTGITTVTAGTLAYGAASALPANTNLTLAGGTLDVANFNSVLSEVTLAANGTFNVGNALELTGNLVNFGGNRTLAFTGAGTTTMNGDYILLSESASARTLTLAVNAGNVVVNSIITNGPGAASSFIKTGAGNLQITTAAQYTGTTTINGEGGIVRLTGSGSLSSGNLTVTAGILKIEGANQTVGTLTMGGGAAGNSALIEVAAGRILTPSSITYTGTNNLASVITGAGTLNLGTNGITVSVADNTALDSDMIWSINTVIGSGAFIKTGAGTLDVGGVTNFDYNATSYQINAGAIVGLDQGDANIILNGGVFEGNGSFTRALGSGQNQVQWAAGTGGGGFSAAGGNLTVAISGGPNPLVWGVTPFFVPTGAPLIFGSLSADSVVDFTNNIDLNNTSGAVTRTITVNDNVDVATDKAVISGNLTASGGGAVTLTKTGLGTLQLAGNNSFSGNLALNAGALQFSIVANLGGSAAIPLNFAGGTLDYIGSGGVDLSGPVAVATATSTIRNSSPGILTLSGPVTLSASFNVSGISPVNFTNALNQSGGDRTVTVTAPTATFNNINLTESSTGRTLVFNVNAGSEAVINGVIANGSTGSSAFRTDGAGTVTVTTSPTFNNELRVNNGILKLQASMSNQTATNSIVFSNTAVSGSTPTLNLDGAGVAYNLTGAIIYVGNSSVTGTARINGTGALNLNGASRTIEVRPSNGTSEHLVIDAAIVNNSGTAAGFTKTRNGTLVLTGTNTYNGNTAVNEGILRLDYRGNTGNKIGGVLTMAGGTLELIRHASLDVAQSITGLTVSTGANRILLDSAAGGNVSLNITGALTSTAAGRSIDFALLGSGSTINTTGATGWTLANGILGGWATFNGSSFATLNASNHVIGLAASVKDDVSTWAMDENVVNSGAFTGVTASLSRINSLAFSSATATDLSVGDYLNLNSGGILVAPSVGANTTAISGGELTSAGAALFVHQHNPAAALTLGSAIRGNTSLTKNGEGTLIVDSSLNDTSGAVFINRGTLITRGGNALTDTGAVTLDPVTGALLKLEANERIGSLAGGGSDGGWLDIGNHVLTLTNGSTFSGKISGSGTLVKWGTANLNVANFNSSEFTGSVIVNQGLFQLSGNGIANLPNSTSLTVNPGAAFLIDNNSSSSAPDRFGNSAPIIVNSANGASSVATRGLWTRATNQNGTRGENLGALSVNSGSSYAALEGVGTSTGTSTVIEFLFDDISRSNNATLSVRGTNLASGASIQRTRFRIDVTAAQTAFMANHQIGAGSTAGAANLRIVPWAIGQDLISNNFGTVSNNELGNSLVTYVSGVGFRPLNFSNEYATYAVGGVSDNVRQSLTTDLTGLTGKTINSLVIDNASAVSPIAVEGSGNLVVSSGAFLFTAVDAVSASGAQLATPQGITIRGFDSITVGPTANSVGNEFVFHAMNTAGAGITIQSNLVNSAIGNTSLTKSGPGTLILTGNNSYSGATTLNEGMMVINSWLAIGGASGTAPLVFAGGTLQLAPGFTGDFTRSGGIRLAQAGGTLDTNGSDLTLQSGLVDLGTMSGGLTKTGLGTLTLAAVSSNTGIMTVAGGTLRLGISQGIGTGDLVVNNAIFDLNGFDATVGLVTLADAAGSTITGAGVLTSHNSQFDLRQGAVTSTLAGSSSLIKTGANTVTLSGLNTYTGVTEVRAGTLAFNSIADVGGVSALGQATTAETAAIRVGLTTTTGTLLYNGSGHSSNRRIDLVGTTGGLTLTQNGNLEALVLSGGIRNAGPGNKTLTFQGTNTAANEISGVIQEGQNGVLSVIKSQPGTWVLGAQNNYTGSTSINEGVLRLKVAQNLTGVLNFGSANNVTTAGTLEVNESSTFGGLVVQTNSSANTNRLILAAGKSINTNGNVVIGTSVASLSNTLFNASGDGVWNVTNLATAAQFRVGGSSGSGNVTQADLSALAELNVSLNTTDGVFRVGSTSGTNVSNTFSVLKLAKDTTVTAATLAIGDGGQYNSSAGQINQMQLGIGETLLNVNTLNIGTGTRDLGSLTFQTNAGSLKVRAADGVSATSFNMGTGTSTTGATLPTGNRNTFDVTGHDADLLFSSVNIGTQNGRTGALENLFAFDQGTLVMTSLTMGSKTATGNSTNTLNLGGGTVNIGSGSGTAITLSSNTNSGTVSSAINITGGTVTVTGNIVRGNNTGAGSAIGSLNLDGGILDMSGNAIGSLTNPIGLTAASGTLRNLGEFNGGAALIKATSGILTLSGVNNYTGGTSITGGTLLVNNLTGSGTGTGSVSVNLGTLLGGTGRISGSVINGGTLAPGGVDGFGVSTLGQLNIGSLTSSAESVLLFQIGGATAIDPAAVELYLSNPSGFSVPASWTQYEAGITQHDQLVFNDANPPVLNTTIQISNSYLNGFVPSYGQVFQFLDWASLGTASATGSPNFNLPTLTGLLNWDTGLFASHGIIVVVPEPSRVLFLLLGLMGLCFRRRR